MCLLRVQRNVCMKCEYYCIVKVVHNNDTINKEIFLAVLSRAAVFVIWDSLLPSGLGV